VPVAHLLGSPVAPPFSSPCAFYCRRQQQAKVLCWQMRTGHKVRAYPKAKVASPVACALQTPTTGKGTLLAAEHRAKLERLPVLGAMLATYARCAGAEAREEKGDKLVPALPLQGSPYASPVAFALHTQQQANVLCWQMRTGHKLRCPCARSAQARVPCCLCVAYPTTGKCTLLAVAKRA
jgi:hypothetical protein